MGRGRRWIAVAMLTAFSAVLSGCSSSMSNFDPTDMLDFLDTKKKLPGTRKAVFPEGVPGLQPGVPKDLYKGAQAEPEPVSAAPAMPESKGRAAAKSRTASRGAAGAPRAIAPSQAEPDASDEGGAAAVPSAPKEAKPRVVRRRTTAPPADEQPAPQAAKPPPAPAQAARPAPAAPTQSASSPFPAPLPSGSFSR